MTKQILIDDMDKIRDFVSEMNECPYDAKLSSISNARQTVNAKSIMGIFSLDVCKPLNLNIDCDDERDANASGLMDRLSRFSA